MKKIYFVLISTILCLVTPFSLFNMYGNSNNNISHKDNSFILNSSNSSSNDIKSIRDDQTLGTVGQKIQSLLTPDGKAIEKETSDLTKDSDQDTVGKAIISIINTNIAASTELIDLLPTKDISYLKLSIDSSTIILTNKDNTDVELDYTYNLTYQEPKASILKDGDEPDPGTSSTINGLTIKFLIPKATTKYTIELSDTTFSTFTDGVSKIEITNYSTIAADTSLNIKNPSDILSIKLDAAELDQNGTKNAVDATKYLEATLELDSENNKAYIQLKAKDVTDTYGDLTGTITLSTIIENVTLADTSKSLTYAYNIPESNAAKIDDEIKSQLVTTDGLVVDASSLNLLSKKEDVNAFLNKQVTSVLNADKNLLTLLGADDISSLNLEISDLNFVDTEKLTTITKVTYAIKYTNNSNATELKDLAATLNSIASPGVVLATNKFSDFADNFTQIQISNYADLKNYFGDLTAILKLACDSLTLDDVDVKDKFDSYFSVGIVEDGNDGYIKLTYLNPEGVLGTFNGKIKLTSANVSLVAENTLNFTNTISPTTGIKEELESFLDAGITGVDGSSLNIFSSDNDIKSFLLTSISEKLATDQKLIDMLPNKKIDDLNLNLDSYSIDGDSEILKSTTVFNYVIKYTDKTEQSLKSEKITVEKISPGSMNFASKSFSDFSSDTSQVEITNYSEIKKYLGDTTGLLTLSFETLTLNDKDVVADYATYFKAEVSESDDKGCIKLTYLNPEGVSGDFSGTLKIASTNTNILIDSTSDTLSFTKSIAAKSKISDQITTDLGGGITADGSELNVFSSQDEIKKLILTSVSKTLSEDQTLMDMLPNKKIDDLNLSLESIAFDDGQTVLKDTSIFNYTIKYLDGSDQTLTAKITINNIQKGQIILASSSFSDFVNNKSQIEITNFTSVKQYFGDDISKEFTFGFDSFNHSWTDDDGNAQKDSDASKYFSVSIFEDNGKGYIQISYSGSDTESWGDFSGNVTVGLTSDQTTIDSKFTSLAFKLSKTHVIDNSKKIQSAINSATDKISDIKNENTALTVLSSISDFNSLIKNDIIGILDADATLKTLVSDVNTLNITINDLKVSDNGKIKTSTNFSFIIAFNTGTQNMTSNNRSVNINSINKGSINLEDKISNDNSKMRIKIQNYNEIKNYLGSSDAVLKCFNIELTDCKYAWTKTTTDDQGNSTSQDGEDNLSSKDFDINISSDGYIEISYNGENKGKGTITGSVSISMNSANADSLILNSQISKTPFNINIDEKSHSKGFSLTDKQIIIIISSACGALLFITIVLLFVIGSKNKKIKIAISGHPTVYKGNNNYNLPKKAKTKKSKKQYYNQKRFKVSKTVEHKEIDYEAEVDNNIKYLETIIRRRRENPIVFDKYDEEDEYY